LNVLGGAKFRFCPKPIKFAQILSVLPKFRLDFVKFLPNLTKFAQI